MAIKTILMIEDDRFIGEMYVRSLRQAGYDVEWAIDGRDGLVMATNKTYDLVLLDIMLPELRGQEILREIKKNPVAKHSHVAVMTNFDQDEETRQEIEQEMLTDILADCPSALPREQTTLCMYRDSFHQGVVGIVASRLKEKFYRPVFVFAPDDDGNYRGSGRSIAGVHLRDVLDAISKRAPDIIIKFGGHAMAAGLTLRSGSLKIFGDLFEDIVRSQVNEDTLSQTFLTDGSLKASDITLANAQLINAQIWGQGFPPPSFADTFQVIRQQSMGADKKHTKAWLAKEGQEFEAMFWRCSEDIPEYIRTVYRPVANEWRNNLELQLYIDYWEAA